MALRSAPGIAPIAAALLYWSTDFCALPLAS